MPPLRPAKYSGPRRARSSAGEHTLHTGEPPPDKQLIQHHDFPWCQSWCRAGVASPAFHDLDERIDLSLLHDLASIPCVKINLTTDLCLDSITEGVRVKRVEFKASLPKGIDKPPMPRVAALGVSSKFRQA